MLRQYHIKNYDFKLILLVVALTVIGIVTIGSANSEFQDNQIMGLFMGLFAMVVVSLIDYSFILRFSWVIYGVNLLLLILVATSLGESTNNSQRWVSIFGIRFQPSELTKIMLILFFAQFIMLHKERISKLKYIVLSVILLLPPLLLVLKQPDLSTTIMIAIVFCVLMFVGGLDKRIVIGIISVLVPAVIIFLILVVQEDQNLIEGYQRLRIMAWLYPDEYSDSTAYQQLNSIMAIGSGMLFGKGYKNNEITSVKNGNFISEPQTDFIFAIIGEEFGFIGTCAVIILILLIVLECISIARKAKDLAGTLIAMGVATLIGFQSFLNISVATGVMPTTGIPLPFVSYGLSSLLSLYIGVGLLLNVRLQGNNRKQATNQRGLEL